jgi:hypothetical protein
MRATYLITRSSGKNWSPVFLQYDTDRTENDASYSSSIGCIFVAAVTFLPVRCLASKEGLHIQTHKLIGRIYEVLRWDGLRCHPSFIKIGSGFRKLIEGRDLEVTWRSHAPAAEKCQLISVQYRNSPTDIFQMNSLRFSYFVALVSVLLLQTYTSFQIQSDCTIDTA